MTQHDNNKKGVSNYDMKIQIKNISIKLYTTKKLYFTRKF